MLNRNEMEAVINGGGSVLYKGRLITSVEKLPSLAELATTPEELAEAAAELDAQAAKLADEQKALAAKQAPTEDAADAQAAKLADEQKAGKTEVKK